MCEHIDKERRSPATRPHLDERRNCRASVVSGSFSLIAATLIGFAACGDDDEAAPPARAAQTEAPIPKIDVHTHLGVDMAAEIVELLGQQGIVLALNASGGSPERGLSRSIEAQQAIGGRIRPYCNIDIGRALDADWVEYSERMVRECKRMGAVGLKMFKGLGLGLIDDAGNLVPVDDPRFDRMFEVAGELHLPVLIHSGDPQAFFRAPTRDNERYDELSAHPDWSFYGPRPDGGQWPSWEEIFAQYERRVARHPHTTFLGAHFGNAPEEPDRVGRMMDRYPNLVIETGARIPEIGRHDAARMHRFFERYQDRILFGTDFAMGSFGLTLGSSGAEPDTLDRVPFFFNAHWRYFETDDRDFAHPTPIQGRWTIDGIGLARPLLEKLYWRNAARIFDLELPANR